MPARTSPSPTQSAPCSTVEVGEASQSCSPPAQISDLGEVNSVDDWQLPEAMEHLQMNADYAMDDVGQQAALSHPHASVIEPITALGK